MVRTRKVNKANRKSYAAVFSLGSDDSGSDVAEAHEANGDVDFNMEDAPQGERSEEDEVDIEQGDEPAEKQDLQEEELDTQSTNTTEQHTPDESEDSDDIDAPSTHNVPMRKGRRLPKRVHIHEVPTYPIDLRATRIHDGPLKDRPRSEELFNLLYGPDPGHIKVFLGMLGKWFDRQLLPSGRVGEEGVMSSPWLSEDFEEKSRHWCRMWHDRARAAKLQRLQKIRPDHVDMFKPQNNRLICVLGFHSHQKQIRTSYGYGQPVTENGQPSNIAGVGSRNDPAPKGWLLDTGGIPIALGWAPSTGRKEQFLAVCSVPFSDQEPKDGSSPDDNPEEKKTGSVQLWSIPCHRTDCSAALMAQSLSFDWGRPKRLQWCPVPSTDESNIGMLAILAADGFVRVIEVLKATSGPANYGRQAPFLCTCSPLMSCC